MSDLAQQLRDLIDQGLNFGECVDVFAERRGEDELAYVRAADEVHAREGELEVDENAIVSKGEDAGAYVMAWVWVTRDEAGLEPEV